MQQWIDGLINADGKTGLSSKTVNRKLGEIRNYWAWLQSHQIVADDHNPFAGRRVVDPASRRKGKEELRQRFGAKDVVRCWEVAEERDDAPLAAAIRIAAYSGARIEGVSQLQTTDIRFDPEYRHPVHEDERQDRSGRSVRPGASQKSSACSTSSSKTPATMAISSTVQPRTNTANEVSPWVSGLAG